MDKVEGAVGTWSHCGDRRPHKPHLHSVVMNEGASADVQCLGTAERMAAPPRRHTARLRLDVRRIVADLGLPARAQVLAIEAKQDPVSFDVIVQDESLPPVPENCESPLLYPIYGADSAIVGYQLSDGQIWSTR